MSGNKNINLSEDVDQIVQGWEEQRPDFDAQPLAVFSRLLRLSRHIELARRNIFSNHGLETWEFEMLSALRREVGSYTLTAGQLMQDTLVSSGTITNRIKRMQEHGLVKRTRDVEDRRVVYVQATEKGLATVDSAMAALLAVQHRMLENVSAEHRKQVVDFLQQLLTEEKFVF